MTKRMEQGMNVVVNRAAAALLVILIFLGTGKGLTEWLVSRRLKAYSPPGKMLVLEEDGLIHVLVKGEGKPVVLLHGDGGSIYDWEMSLLDPLSDEYQVVAVDRPGFGFSQGLEQNAGPFAQVEIIRDALQKLELQDPILVGHSRGGNLALAYGLLYPGEIQGIVTLAAAPYGGDIGWYSRLMGAPAVGPAVAYTWAVPFGKPFVKAGLREAFAPEHSPPPAYLKTYTAFELRPQQLLAHARDQLQGRERVSWMMEQYEDLEVPLVIVHSADDQLVPFQQALRLHRSVPCSRLLELSDAGHEIMFTRPDLVKFGLEMLENYPGPHAPEGEQPPDSCRR